MAPQARYDAHTDFSASLESVNGLSWPQKEAPLSTMRGPTSGWSYGCTAGAEFICWPKLNFKAVQSVGACSS